MSDELKWCEVGYKRSYPQEDREIFWLPVCRIPWQAVLALALITIPEIKLGLGYTVTDFSQRISHDWTEKQKEDLFRNTWLNKVMVVVGNGHEEVIALYHHDYDFWILRGEKRKETKP